MNPTFKSLVLFLCALASWSLMAQTDLSSAVASAGTTLARPAQSMDLSDTEAFQQAARARGIGVRTLEAVTELDPGYYLVAGVFSKRKNIRRMERTLRKDGLEPGNFVNPENELFYIYVNRYSSPESALDAAATEVHGKYAGDLWILVVEGDAMPQTTVEPQETDRPAETSAQLSDNESPDKLIRKADVYYDKLWFAEAADLYETALRRSPENASARVIKRLADSHYFNTDMERALYWYDQLYQMEADQMSAENLFRYAHSLKGNGKYSRARRFMRLYDRKAAASARPGRAQIQERETVLDNILSAADGFTIKNLSVNSRYSDFAPMFYGEDKVVYASSVDSAFFHTRRYKWNDQPYLDLYIARVNEEAEDLTGAVKFSKTLNTKYHEAGVTFSPDGQTIYFTRNNYGKKLRRDKNGVNHLKLYMSRKVNGEWTEAVELPFNGEHYSTGHPALSPDGKQLYFVSDMPGSIGDTDIFVVDVLGDGQFSEPRNLGPEINTEQKEMFPFITDKTLYFSSNGHVGLGGLDVYEVSFDEENENGFLEVRNVGKPINSSKDDFSFIMDPETQKGYFASNRRGGKGDDDLYSFQRLIPEEANENAIAGVVTDLVTGDYIPNALVALLDENNVKLKEVLTDEQGGFVFEELQGNTRYKIGVNKEDYREADLVVETLDNQQVLAEVSLRKLEERIIVENGIRKLKTENIYFDFDKFGIRADAARELDKLVATLNEYPDMVIAIESHTDSRGPKAYNKYLSDKRAKATRQYLISQGIDPNRIQSAVGYGEERLLNDCDGSVRCSREQHQANRRSEFIIVSM